MGYVIGVLVGLIATAVYAVGAAELLLGETGVDLLEAARTRVPPDVLVWLTRVPLEAPEGAPMWRTVVISIALASGIAGGLFLIVRAQLSAVMLWLTFLLLAGVFLGQDLAVAGGYKTATLQGLAPITGTLVAALLIAIIAHAVTSRPPEPEPVRSALGYPQAERVRDLIRAEPARRRSPFAEPDPEPRRPAPPPEPEPVARRAAPPPEAAPESRPEPRPTPPEPRPAPEPSDLLQSDDLLPAKT